ncbi:MAG: hypothetical protein SH820_08870 [Xanthomonadales bacterium]|nr:hypothetical protein [Xanthomonadales bacterium]
MKDLYLQLGINPDAGKNDIEAAMVEHPELADVAAILLNESKRATYNRTVSTIRSIGMLRHRLGLDNENSWFVEHCPDFAPSLQPKKYTAQAQPDAGVATAAARTHPGQTSSNKTKSWFKLLAIGMGIAAVLLFLISVL